MATDYPREFTAESRNRIETEKLRASKQLDQLRNEGGPSSEAEANLQKYILRVVLAFAKEACSLVAGGAWTLDMARRETEDDFLRHLVIEAYFEQGHNKQGRKIRDWNDNILPEVKRKLSESSEWQGYKDALLAAAEARLQSLGENSIESDETPLAGSIPKARMPATVTSPSAARRMEEYLRENGISQTEFSISAHTTDRTIRQFRKTGKVRRDIFENIAKAMGVGKEALLKP